MLSVIYSLWEKRGNVPVALGNAQLIIYSANHSPCTVSGSSEDGDTIPSPSLFRGSLHSKKNSFIYFSVRYFEVFFGSCLDFFIVTINEIGCCVMFD